MATNPPSGYEAPDASWADNFDVNTVLTNRVGDSTIEFKNTTPGSNETLQSEDVIPCEGGASYYLSAWVQADSVAAGRTVTIAADFFQGDGSTAAGTVTALNGAVLRASGSWQHYGAHMTIPTGARYYKLRVEKDTTNAFTLYLDHIGMKRLPTVFGGYRNAAQSISASTWTTIVVDTAANNYNFTPGLSLSTGVFTAPRSSFYHFDMRASLSGLADGDQVTTRFIYGASGPNGRGGQNIEIGGAGVCALTASADLWLDDGDTVAAQIWHNSGGARSLGVGNPSSSWFSGHEIGF